MDFLLDALTEWLKEMLVGGIMGNLSGMFDSVNQQVGDISVQVGQTPQGCYDQEKTAKKLTPKGYAGFTRIHHIWTEGIPDVPKLFIGSPIQDRDMARGTLMALFLSTTVFPAETIQIPVYAETCVLLDDLMAGGWYA